jgi:peptidase C39-like protein
MIRIWQSGFMIILIGVAVQEPVAAQERAYPPTDFVPPAQGQTPGSELIGKPVEWDIPKGLVTPPALRFDQPFQQGPSCGPNALYFLLRLCEVNVAYDAVLKRVPLVPQGSNIEDLRQAAAEFGLATEVRRLTPEELVDAPKPLLVHVNVPASGSGQTGEGLGHFILITRTTPGGYFRGIDTTNALVTTWPPEFFARNGSGYALVVASRSRSWLLTPKGLALGSAFLVVMGLNEWIALRLRK